jgi:hypothetical protein
MDYSLADALPEVYYVKNGKYYDVHWDCHGVEADQVLNEYQSYIEGYLDGCYQILSIDHKLPDLTYGHRTGYVRGISKQAAIKLEAAIKELLYELVTERYKQLEKAEQSSKRLKSRDF